VFVTAWESIRPVGRGTGVTMVRTVSKGLLEVDLDGWKRWMMANSLSLILISLASSPSITESNRNHQRVVSDTGW
jgi:hypothetical protein